MKQRILEYLSGLPYDAEQEFSYSTTLPRDVCQDGIADGVGVSRAHASLELVELIDEGMVGERLAHVEGSHRRRKVYYLTEV